MRVVQTLRVARTLEAPMRFVVDVIRDANAATYRSKRTGYRVQLRPRADLQVARELVSKDNYRPPTEVQTLLRGPSRILDLGANIGLYALSAIQHFGPETYVVAVEPDPGNYALLSANIRENGLESQVERHFAAGGIRRGHVYFRSGLGHVSHVTATSSTEGAEIIEVPLIDTFHLARSCDLVKLDIEGGEWDILRDSRLARLDAKAIVLEWHMKGPYSPDPGAEAAQLLENAGYTVRHDPPIAKQVGGLWAWRASTAC